ncbi:UDP-glucose flavonoid 3-O-glucosyltransferase 7-like [Ziziphus jujuba]|uniref:Glycosyltransferase n=1 Tax=Ziziphus jujuba TaxID=326968 RepID=A0A6P4A9Q8_ZIZJJ|nr:UDP-glucose flavonoid 3-O-glucosyltransferase 7-like [Ziziphus jujuba]
MGSSSPQLHIFFFPLMAQGHIIPVIDMAKLFASRGLRTTIVSTPLNAQLHSNKIQRIKDMGIEIEVVLIKFPASEVGLPEGCESSEMATTPEMQQKFFKATTMLENQLERLIHEHHPHCLVADVFFPWATDVAARFGIPRLVFHGIGFFSLCASLSVLMNKPQKKVLADSEPFDVPKLPDEVKLTRNQLPTYAEGNGDTEFSRLFKEGKESELKSYGVIVNSFYELECAYADHYRQVLGRKAWHIGPISLFNKTIGKDNESRGMEASIDCHDDDQYCLKWLDSKKPDSVVYVCFGTMSKFNDSQLLEIAEGLEASGQNFIWVVRKDKAEELRKEEWLPEGFEKRMEGKGLIVRGWAPQVLILDHEAVGGFVTHCGWNSTLEGVSAGVPMVTWPMWAEQFYNEKLITQILGIGVGVGAKKWARLVGDSVKREAVEKAVIRIMVGEEAGEIRSKARGLGKMARRAVEEGGSSNSDLNSLIEELRSLGSST